MSIAATALMSPNLAEALPIAPVQITEGTEPTLVVVRGVHAGGHHGGHNVYRGGHNTVVVGGRGA